MSEGGDDPRKIAEPFLKERFYRSRRMFRGLRREDTRVRPYAFIPICGAVGTGRNLSLQERRTLGLIADWGGRRLYNPSRLGPD